MRNLGPRGLSGPAGGEEFFEIVLVSCILNMVLRLLRHLFSVRVASHLQLHTFTAEVRFEHVIRSDSGAVVTASLTVRASRGSAGDLQVI